MKTLENQKELEQLYMKRLNGFKPELMKVFPDLTDRQAHLLSILIEHKAVHIKSLIPMVRQPDESMQAAADWLAEELQNNRYKVNGLTISTLIVPSADLQNKWDRCHHPFPLVVPPKKIKNNNDSGYFGIKQSVVLKNKTDEFIPLDVLNKLNQIPLEVNEFVLNNCVNTQANLDEPSPMETPFTFMRRTSLFKVFNEELHKFADYLGKDPIWFNHRYDKRGRIYPQGYHMNPQGNDYAKALMTFHKKEYLTDEGIYWLKIAVASSYGLDKKLWSERIDWFEEHEHELESFASEADEPCMYAAAVNAWRQHQQGLPVSFPMGLDATTSGLQILSAMTGDRRGAELSNLIDTGKRTDAYRELTNIMNDTYHLDTKFAREDCKRAIMTSLYGSEKEPENLFGDNVEYFYNTMNNEIPSVWNLNKFFLRAWNPKWTTYGWDMPDGFAVRIKVKGLVFEEVSIGGITVITQYYKHKAVKMSRSLGANVTHSVDGYLCREMIRRCGVTKDTKQRVMNALNYTGSAYPEPDQALMVKSLWAKYKECGMLSSMILDYIDESTIQFVDRKVIKDLLDSLPPESFEVLPIHDCFRCHPNYAGYLTEQYRNLMVELASSNLLVTILKDLGITVAGSSDATPEFIELMKQSKYALC